VTHDTHDTSDTREIADTSDAREIADNTSDAREIADTNDARHARETRGRRDSRRGRVKGHVESEHMQDTTPETRDMSRASTCKTPHQRRETCRERAHARQNATEARGRTDMGWLRSVGLVKL